MDTLMQSIRQRAADYREDFLIDLERFVNIDSGTSDKVGVDAASAYFGELLTGIGCELEVFPNATRGANLRATLRGTGEGSVMLLGHCDTVFAAGTVAERPFTIHGDRALGPGVSDMKGGLMLGYYAMRIAQEIASDQFSEITFVVNGDEEIGSPTSRDLIESSAKQADAVLALEPRKRPGGVMLTRKGAGIYDLIISGRASHAGSAPEDGRSANLELAHKIIALHDLNDFETGTTVSVNLISGGSARNVISAEARATIDVRVMTAADAETVERRIRDIIARSWVDGTFAQLTGGLNRPPLEPTSGTPALLDVAKEILAELELEFTELTSGGFSDGNFTAAIGVPTLDGLGMVGFNNHGIEEYVELAPLADRMALVTGLIIHAPERDR